MNSRTYQLTQAQYEGLQKKVEADGFPPPADPNNWEVSKSGVTLSGFYADGHLTLEIVTKPFIMPASVIWDKIESWISL